jgi:hypothetical protein
MTRSLEASSKASSESSANDESIDQLMNLDEAGLFSYRFIISLNVTQSMCDTVRHCPVFKAWHLARSGYNFCSRVGFVASPAPAAFVTLQDGRKGWKHVP